MFSLQVSMISVQLHSSHLYMCLYVWYVYIESMTKELESKMCNISSFWVVLRTGYLKFHKFLFSWIPLINIIIMRCNMLMLWSKSKKFWTISYFCVLLLVLITIFYDFCSVNSSHLYMSLHVWYVPIETMIKKLE